MKICVCGKGGSGKSTIIAVLADVLRGMGKEVFILDADESNTTLYRMLDFDSPPRPLMDMVGGKKSVQQKMMAQFSTDDGKPPITLWEMERVPVSSIPSAFLAEKSGYKLVVTGKIHQSMEGCACPMGVVTREFLKKLELKDTEIALIDMEAGIEHFGRGIESSVDVVIGVVDPSLESIALARNVMALTKGAGALFKGVVLNKIMSEEQIENVQARLHELEVPIIGTIGFSEDLQSACLQGRPITSSFIPSQAQAIAEELLGQS